MQRTRCEGKKQAARQVRCAGRTIVTNHLPYVRLSRRAEQLEVQLRGCNSGTWSLVSAWRNDFARPAAGIAFFVEGKIPVRANPPEPHSIVAEADSGRRTCRAESMCAAKVLIGRGAASCGLFRSPLPGFNPSLLAREVSGQVFACKQNASWHAGKPSQNSQLNCALTGSGQLPSRFETEKSPRESPNRGGKDPTK